MGTDFSKKPVLEAKSLPYCLDDIKEENIARIVSEGVVGDYEVSVKLIGERFWTPIFVGTGTVDTTIDISLYDNIRISTLTAVTEGTIAISAFLIPGSSTMTPTGGDATAANQVATNVALGNILNELQTNPELECAETPTIFNINVSATGMVYDVLLPTDTKRFLIRHRNQGNIEFAFEPTMASFITVPKGTSYTDKDLCLISQIIYFRSTKPGIIEIIAWT